MTKTVLLLAGLCMGLATLQAQEKIVPTGLCLENYDYGYPVQYLAVKNQGQTLQMAFMDVQPTGPANGHVVLLLHGKNFNGAYWLPTAQALAQAGYQVVIPDQIGFGKSSKPEHLQYSFQLLAQNTKAVLDSLGVQKVSVVGHSMGGMLATRFTLMYPDLVEKFILEDPIGLEDWKLKVPYQSVDAWYQRELAQTYDSFRKYEQESYYHGTWRPEYDHWLGMQAGWTLNPEYSRIAWNSALTYDMIFTQPVCYEFGLVHVPTLLIIGELDKTALGKDLVSPEVRSTMGNYPELGRQTQQKIPGCKLVELAGIGHIPHIEDPSQFVKILTDFLKN